MVKFKDVVHLYLGCKVVQREKIFGNLVSVTIGYDEGLKLKTWYLNIRHKDTGVVSPEFINYIKPILRPLSDMNMAERMNVVNPMVFDLIENGYGSEQHPLIQSAELTKYLLEQNFDLFKLIENGFAIDKTEIRIKNAYTNEYIGSIFDISIPDPDTDDEDFVRFNSIVEDWLTDNYYN